jgi:hypothetical protein
MPICQLAPFVELYERATRRVAGGFLRLAAVPYKINTVLTGNGTHFTDPTGDRPPLFGDRRGYGCNNGTHLASGALSRRASAGPTGMKVIDRADPRLRREPVWSHGTYARSVLGFLTTGAQQPGRVTATPLLSSLHSRLAAAKSEALESTPAHDST